MEDQVKQLGQDVELLKSYLRQSYVPQYFDQFTQRVGQWDAVVRRAQSNAEWAVVVSVVTMFLTVLVVSASLCFWWRLANFSTAKRHRAQQRWRTRPLKSYSAPEFV